MVELWLGWGFDNIKNVLEIPLKSYYWQNVRGTPSKSISLLGTKCPGAGINKYQGNKFKN